MTSLNNGDTETVDVAQRIKSAKAGLSEITSLTSVATPGPWHAEGTNIGYAVHGERYAVTSNPTLADAEFIAASRTHVPQLSAAASELVFLCEMATMQRDDTVAVREVLDILSRAGY